MKGVFDAICMALVAVYTSLLFYLEAVVKISSKNNILSNVDFFHG